MMSPKVKRFYKVATVERGADGFALLLDGRTVKTPARQPLVLPTQVLAEAVANEWRAQGEDIVIASMPMTGFANAAIDRVVPRPDLFVREIASFGETDTLCYRAEPEEALAKRQNDQWEPLLEWAENRYDIRFVRIVGVIHQPQPEHSLSRLEAAVAALNPFVLAPLVTITSIGGSLVSALALVEGEFGIDAIWQAVCLEELWQEELWGAEEEAVKARLHRKAAFDDAHRFALIARDSLRER